MLYANAVVLTSWKKTVFTESDKKGCSSANAALSGFEEQLVMLSRTPRRKHIPCVCREFRFVPWTVGVMVIIVCSVCDDEYDSINSFLLHVADTFAQKIRDHFLFAFVKIVEDHHVLGFGNGFVVRI